MRVRVTASELRDTVRKEIESTIEYHRGSREFNEEDYRAHTGPPTEQEVTDFIRTNQLFDTDTIRFLTEPDQIGFQFRMDSVRAEWLEEFHESISGWADTESWLGADLIDIIELVEPELIETYIWQPELTKIQPSWITKSPTALMIAADLLKSGKLLSELDWRDFEKMIAILLEKSGWEVDLMQGSKDGGIDVVASLDDPILGRIRSLWQAKKYHPKNKVQLHHVRDLSAVRDDQKATKAVIVTTSNLTKGALNWIRRDKYRLDYRDRNDMEKWVLDSV
ncbi:MAG: restriction endonuclease [FCB group bacterium]|nr:restriction endonuclease [FCB group bacterium]